jgi:pimeloyl-ACP methyl ester carboxylesterase
MDAGARPSLAADDVLQISIMTSQGPTMQTVSLNGTDVIYEEAGSGPLLLLIHGQLCDHRFWWAQMGSLAKRYRVIAPSLRHYWPDHCDETSATFTTHQHALDLGALIDALGEGPVDLCGHSRGGYVAFRVAQLFPEKVRALVLADPGGPVDISDDPAQEAMPPAPTPIDDLMPIVVDRLKANDVDGGLALFFDVVQGKGAWSQSPEPFRVMARSNAMTLLAQAIFEPRRKPITLAQIRAVAAPTLLIGGAQSPSPFPGILSAFERSLATSSRITIADASHAMNIQDPTAFNEAVLGFVDRMAEG